MNVQPYLFFEGRCDEAIEFYRSVLGAQPAHIHRYKDNPQPGAAPPGSEDKIMHASLRVGESKIHVSDGHCSGQANFHGFSLMLNVDNQADAQRIFAALANGGKVRMALQKTFYSPAFGMVADRFGVLWMIMVSES